MHAWIEEVSTVHTQFRDDVTLLFLLAQVTQSLKENKQHMYALRQQRRRSVTSMDNLDRDRQPAAAAEKLPSMERIMAGREVLKASQVGMAALPSVFREVVNCFVVKYGVCVRPPLREGCAFWEGEPHWRWHGLEGWEFPRIFSRGSSVYVLGGSHFQTSNQNNIPKQPSTGHPRAALQYEQAPRKFLADARRDAWPCPEGELDGYLHQVRYDWNDRGENIAVLSGCFRAGEEVKKDSGTRIVRISRLFTDGCWVGCFPRRRKSSALREEVERAENGGGPASEVRTMSWPRSKADESEWTRLLKRMKIVARSRNKEAALSDAAEIGEFFSFPPLSAGLWSIDSVGCSVLRRRYVFCLAWG